MNVALVIFLSTFTLILPLSLIAWLWRTDSGSGTARILKLSIAASAFIFIFNAGMWGFYSYYLRFVFAVCFIAAAYRFLSRPPIHSRREIKTPAFAGGLIVLATTIVLNILVIRGYSYDGIPLRLSFPLKGGSYYVIQGGNSIVTNVFHGLYKTINAVDIVKLNKAGNRASGIFPEDLSDYDIFGDAVYSPCDGRVIKAADGLPDLVPHDVDIANYSGNHLIIECEGVNILIAHMMKGSLLVGEGEAVKEGQLIGKVGNSGNTFEPHLHIHAVRSSDSSLKGKSVPMVFDGRFLSLNSVVTASP